MGTQIDTQRSLPAFLLHGQIDEFGGLPQEVYGHFLHLAFVAIPAFEHYTQVVALWEMTIQAEAGAFSLAVALIPAVYLHNIGARECLQETIKQIHGACRRQGQSLTEWLQFASQLEHLSGPFLLPYQ